MVFFLGMYESFQIFISISFISKEFFYPYKISFPEIDFLATKILIKSNHIELHRIKKEKKTIGPTSQF